jgi:hypothetical protein
MKTKIFTVANGNLTALVSESKKSEHLRISKELMETVEQVGFISEENVPTLSMMGNELCINATIAFASTLQKEGQLMTSGVVNPVLYSNNNTNTTIRIVLPFQTKENIVLFEGIGFIFFSIKDKSTCTKEEIKYLCELHRLAAFSGIIYEGNKILPFVYVKETDSFIKETSCGSGSIAFSIYSGIQEVIQPTQEKIYIERDRNTFLISAKVECIENL